MQVPYLAIDPGISTGWARMDANLNLVECGAGNPAPCAYRVVLIERPQVYPNSPTGKSNNLITLALGAGRYEERFATRGATVRYVLPHDWKGTLEKRIHHPRILRELRTDAERAVVALGCKGVSEKRQEDLMDAVGLAAYARRFHIFV